MPIVPGLEIQVAQCTWESGWAFCSYRSSTVSLWTPVLFLQFLESCDEVILLEDGEICEKGTHKELMEERGRYAKLIHNLRGLQFKVTVCLPMSGTKSLAS